MIFALFSGAATLFRIFNVDIPSKYYGNLPYNFEDRLEKN